MEDLKIEIKKELLEIINDIENPYWLAHICKYINALKKKENI